MWINYTGVADGPPNPTTPKRKTVEKITYMYKNLFRQHSEYVQHMLQ